MAVTNSPRLGLPRWSEGTDLHPNRAEWDAQQGLLDDLVAIDVEVATYADRPSPKRGIYMWVVDEQRLYRATSTGWMTTAKIGGGGRGTPVTIGSASAAVEGVSAYAARADHTHSLPLASSTVDGAMAKADKAKLDTATTAASGGSLVQRSAAGSTFFNSVLLNTAPTSAEQATRKDYVDAGDAGRFPMNLSAGTGSINNLLDPGQYVQPSATPVTTANGYPIDGGAGSLLVYNFGSGSSTWKIQEWTDWGSRRRFLRATNGGAGAWSEWRELAGTETATSSADGLMSKADKAKLDTATASNSYNSLMSRNASGDTRVSNLFLDGTSPASNQAVRKDYVDTSISNAVGAIPNATSSVDGLMPKADKSKLDSAIYTAVANSLVQRDSGGRARFEAPVNGYDAANKSYADSKAASAASAAVSAIPNASSTVDGLMAKGDKTILDSATISAIASTLVKRDSNSQINVPSTPTSANHSASKSYVDAQDAKQVTAATSLGTSDLDTISTDGNYVQTSNANATTARNYPVGGTYAGLLVVSSYSSFIFQTYMVYNGSSSYAAKTFTRTKYGSNWSSWRESASTDLATSSADGLMSKADKSLLDTATVNNTANSLVRRSSTGGITVRGVELAAGEPTSAAYATPKSYVDNAIANAVPAVTALSSSTDLNTIKTPGKYRMPEASMATNTHAPSYNHAFLTVDEIGSGGEQIVQTWTDSVGRVYTRAYIRSIFGGMMWMPWNRLDYDHNSFFQSGRVSITPSAANTPTSVRVDFNKAFPSDAEVIVSVTPSTTVPGSTVTGCSAANHSNTGFDAYITRTNTTTTWLFWTATIANQ